MSADIQPTIPTVKEMIERSMSIHHLDSTKQFLRGLLEYLNENERLSFRQQSTLEDIYKQCGGLI
jgi:hypothetical protein